MIDRLRVTATPPALQKPPRIKCSTVPEYDIVKFANQIGSSLGQVDHKPDINGARKTEDLRAAAKTSEMCEVTLQKHRDEVEALRKANKCGRSIHEKARALKFLVVIDSAMHDIKKNLKNAALYKGKLDWTHLFKEYDRDKSGWIEFEEFRQLIRRSAKTNYKILPDDMLHQLFDAIDDEKCGEVATEDLISWLESPDTSLWDEVHKGSYHPLSCQKGGGKHRILIQKKFEKKGPVSKDEVMQDQKKQITELKQRLQDAQEEIANPKPPPTPPPEDDDEVLDAPDANRPWAPIPEEKEPDRFFAVSVSRVHGESLGLHLSANMVVEKVTWDGQIGLWNAREAERIVDVGDKIVEVNGRKGPTKILRELKKQKKLDLFLCRSPKPKSFAMSLAERRKKGNTGTEDSEQSNEAFKAEADNPDYIVKRVNVEVNRDTGSDLGVDLSWPHLKVLGMTWSGLVAGWNRSCRKEKDLVKVGDRIVMANNHTTPEEIFYECKRKAMLNLVFERHEKKGLPPKAPSTHILETKKLNPLWTKVRRNLRAHAYHFGGIDFGKLFHRGDVFDSGLMTFEMFTQLVRKPGKITAAEVPDKLLRKIFESLDADGSGEVDVHEFVTWMGIETTEKESSGSDSSDADEVKTKGFTQKIVCKQTKDIDKVVHELRVALFRAGSMNWKKMFDRYDRDNRGVISFFNFKQLMRLDFRVHESVASEAMLRNIFLLMDQDESGEIEFHELFNWLTGEHEDEEDENAEEASDQEEEEEKEPVELVGSDEKYGVGFRVTLEEQHGTVRFIGETQFAEGKWVGIEFDKPVGKNDGSVEGLTYFSCKPNHGLFVQDEVMQQLHGVSSHWRSIAWGAVRGVKEEGCCQGCGFPPEEGKPQTELTKSPLNGKEYCTRCWATYVWPDPSGAADAKKLPKPLVDLKIRSTWTDVKLAQAWLKEPLEPAVIAEAEPITAPEVSQKEWSTIAVCLRKQVVGPDARDAFDKDRPQIGEVLRGRYTVRTVLAEGWYARAHIAEDRKQHGLKVCLKRHWGMSVESLADMMTIAKRMEEIDPREKHFPKLLDAFFDITSFTVETLMDGQNCLSVMNNDDQFFRNLDNLQVLATDCVHGLKLLEQASIVHNDLKADNLLWVKANVHSKKPHVKIVDFNCARLDQRLDPGRNWDFAEGGQGHLGKWPPEMVLGLPITCAADVWGLAVTLCELYTGRFMWRVDKDSKEVILAQALGLCGHNEGVPPYLLKQSPLLLRSFITPGPTEAEPDRGAYLPVRFGTGGEPGLLEALEAISFGLEQILGEKWDESNLASFGQLLQECLVLDPQLRPTALKLLELCPFVQSGGSNHDASASTRTKSPPKSS